MNKYEHMLRNAGSIQYDWNLLNSEEFDDVEFKKVSVVCVRENGRHYRKMMYRMLVFFEDYSTFSVLLEPWEFRFLIKGRELHSGLKTPMARYYAWKAIKGRENHNCYMNRIKRAPAFPYGE